MRKLVFLKEGVVLVEQRGLKDMTIEMLVGLPESDDRDIDEYMGMCSRSEEGYKELRRLLNEAVVLYLADEEPSEEDLANFWRVLRFLPLYPPEDVDDEVWLTVLRYGWEREKDWPMDDWDERFEEILSAMPDEVIYRFLTELPEADEVRCLLRLVLDYEGFVFHMEEEVLRRVLAEGSEVLRAAVLTALDSLAVDFNPELGAELDREWCWLTDEEVEERLQELGYDAGG